MIRPLKECKVLVTPTSFGMDDSTLRTRLEAEVGEVVYNTTAKPLASQALASLIPGIDGYIAGLDEIDRRVIEAADRLRVIARYGVGTDGIDLQAAREKGIVVTNTPGANSISVAELAVGLLLALARNIPYANQETKRGGWPRLHGLSLQGKTVGIIGLGAIGRHFARRLSGFECRLVAYDPAPDVSQAAELGVALLSLEETVSQADFLSLHCPLTDETRGMVNKHFLDKMKPGACLINTARGEIVDEAALFDALKSGRLRGAALDAFSRQPPGADNPLFTLPQVIATPHTGAHTDGATNAMGRMALDELLRVLRGEPPRYRVI